MKLTTPLLSGLFLLSVSGAVLAGQHDVITETRVPSHRQGADHVQAPQAHQEAGSHVPSERHAAPQAKPHEPPKKPHGAEKVHKPKHVQPEEHQVNRP